MKTITVNELHELLRKGIVTFSFKKKNGEIRTATGTTNAEIIAQNYTSRGGEGANRYGYSCYWDLEKEDWRCFTDKNLVIMSVGA